MLEAVITGEYANLKIPEEVRKGFLVSNYHMLQRETGGMTTFQRFLVALEVWHGAKQPGGPPNLNDFDFVYSLYLMIS